jgi:hypothetical protein
MLESVAGTVCVNLYQLPTDGLGGMVAASAVCPQLLDQLHNEENAIQPPHGVHTKITCVHISITLTRGS